MADEVEGLARQIEELKEIVRTYLPLREHEQAQRLIFYRLDEMARRQDQTDRNLEAERKAREAAVERLQNQQESKGNTKAQAVYSVIGQIVGGVILAAIVTWAASKGAH